MTEVCRAARGSHAVTAAGGVLLVTCNELEQAAVLDEAQYIDGADMEHRHREALAHSTPMQCVHTYLARGTLSRSVYASYKYSLQQTKRWLARAQRTTLQGDVRQVYTLYIKLSFI